MRRTIAARFLGIVTTALLAAGCAGTPTKEPPTDVRTGPAAEVRDSVARLALSMVGVQYRYGGASPDEGFDCSGLVYYAYMQNGQAVPRTSQAQFGAATPIPLAEATPGDLLFFRDQEKLSHVGIYLGDGEFVHAPSTGDSVRVASIEAPYYRQNLVAVGRLIP